MIKKILPLNFQWPTQEPFLFCVHHDDRYPAGNSRNGLEARHLEDRDVGQDFETKNGFRLYHGKEIPGFPVHPHRGFETITIVRKGYIDHADSLGAACRYGEGDVQWLTAGAGIQHSEMFPLLHKDKENPVELFQIWLNLPKKNKLAHPEFKILWAEQIPRIIPAQGTEISLISGQYADHIFNQAPQKSWAAETSNEVNILLVKMQPGANFDFDRSRSLTNRTLYFFKGSSLVINGKIMSGGQAFMLDSRQDLKLTAGETPVEFLILEAKPIGEPVVQYGPFVMNSQAEIMQTFKDYERTQFGGWNWSKHDMIHGPEIERFAKFPDGHVERP